MSYLEHNYKPGRELTRVERHKDGKIKSLDRVTVEKVYKNGRIITDSKIDRNENDRPNQFIWNGELFRQAGKADSFSSWVSLFPLTKERTFKAEYKRQQETLEAQVLQRSLSTQLRSATLVTTPAKLAEIDAILNPPKKSNGKA